MNVFIGTSGFSYKEWKGTFYPDTLPTAGMLGFYSRQFSTVEINNTFYRMPKADMLQTWSGQVPSGFRFALKAPQQITHIKRLKDTQGVLEALAKAALGLGDKLGPVLFQLPPNMKKNLDRLAEFLPLVPKAFRPAFEFRHESWLDQETYGLLRAHGAALCVAESEKLQVPLEVTADWGYLRLREVDYDHKMLSDWADRIVAQPWAETFIFFKHEDAGKGPTFAKELAKILSQRTSVQVK